MGYNYNYEFGDYIYNIENDAPKKYKNTYYTSNLDINTLTISRSDNEIMKLQNKIAELEKHIKYIEDTLNIKVSFKHDLDAQIEF